MKKIFFISVLFLCAIVFSAINSNAANLPVGSIIVWSAGTGSDTPDTPAGYLPCGGVQHPVSSYPDLAAVLGNRFGGDGINTFNVPKMNVFAAIANPKFTTESDFKFSAPNGQYRNKYYPFTLPGFFTTLQVGAYHDGTMGKRIAAGISTDGNYYPDTGLYLNMFDYAPNSSLLPSTGPFRGTVSSYTQLIPNGEGVVFYTDNTDLEDTSRIFMQYQPFLSAVSDDDKSGPNLSPSASYMIKYQNGADPEDIEPGSIVLWANPDALPSGYLECNGYDYIPGNYPDLAAVIGSSYSTDGTYKLPKMDVIAAVGNPRTLNVTFQSDTPGYYKGISPQLNTPGFFTVSQTPSDYGYYNDALAKRVITGISKNGNYWETDPNNVYLNTCDYALPKNLLSSYDYPYPGAVSSYTQLIPKGEYAISYIDNVSSTTEITTQFQPLLSATIDDAKDPDSPAPDPSVVYIIKT